MSLGICVLGGVSLAKSDVIVEPLLLEKVTTIKTSWVLRLTRNIMSLSGVVHQTCFGQPDKLTAGLSPHYTHTHCSWHTWLTEGSEFNQIQAFTLH